MWRKQHQNGSPKLHIVQSSISNAIDVENDTQSSDVDDPEPMNVFDLDYEFNENEASSAANGDTVTEEFELVLDYDF